MATSISLIFIAAAMAAQSTPDDQEAALKAQTAYWQEVQAAANAKAAAIQAQSAQFQAAVGSAAGQSSITGKVDVGSDGPKPEALLLTTQASDRAAQKIATELATQLNGRTALLLVTSTDDLSLAQLNFYDMQLHVIGRQLKDARERLENAARTKPPKGARGMNLAVAPVAAIGTVLDAATKLGSYFLTDYTFGKVDASLPDKMLLYSVASQVQPKLSGTQTVFLPSQLAALEVGGLIRDIEDPSNDYQQLVIAADTARGKAKDNPDLAAAIASADAVAKSWETFASALTTAPANGEPAIDRILRQKAIRAKLRAKVPVLVVNSSQAGGYYTKKNLWTFLGGPPLYTDAAVAASYALLDGEDRNIIHSGTVWVNGGYRSVREVQRLFPPGQ